MDPVYGPQLDADGNQVQIPRMETVNLPVYESVGVTREPRTQKETVNVPVYEADGVTLAERPITQTVTRNVLDADGNLIINDDGTIQTETVEENVLNPDGSIRMENYTESTTRNVTDADGNVVMEEYTAEVTRQVEIGGILQFDNAPDVIVDYNPRDISEIRPDNWHYFEDNVDFGSNFTIYEAIFLTASMVVFPESATVVSVPTPTEEQMIKPGYAILRIQQ